MNAPGETAVLPIVTLTMNPAVDFSAAAERVVVERKIRCGLPRRDPGGGGVNVSRAIHELGGETLALFPAGGATGELLTNLLQQQGIEHHSIPVQNWTRENVTVLDESTGEQFRFVMPGAKLSAEEADRCLAALAGCQPKPQYLVASGSLPPGVRPEFFAKLSRLAERLGSRLVVDTSGPALREAAEAGAYLLKPNLRELGELAGRELHDEDEQAQAAQELVRSHQCEIVVVSLGAGGVLVADGSGARRCRTPTVPVKSKVGAGDSMVAGLVLGLARGQSLQEAFLLGLAAGAAAVMTPGTELCRREDTERLYERLQMERLQRQGALHE